MLSAPTAGNSGTRLLHFEERDLRRHLGSAYDDYAQQVPRLVPTPGRGNAAVDVQL